MDINDINIKIYIEEKCFLSNFLPHVNQMVTREESGDKTHILLPQFNCQKSRI